MSDTIQSMSNALVLLSDEFLRNREFGISKLDAMANAMMSDVRSGNGFGKADFKAVESAMFAANDREVIAAIVNADTYSLSAVSALMLIGAMTCAHIDSGGGLARGPTRPLTRGKEARNAKQRRT